MVKAPKPRHAYASPADGSGFESQPVHKYYTFITTVKEKLKIATNCKMQGTISSFA